MEYGVLEVADSDCSVTYTESGATGLSLNCYPLFGGTQCATVSQVNFFARFVPGADRFVKRARGTLSDSS